jgi:hypothetical protein
MHAYTTHALDCAEGVFETRHRVNQDSVIIKVVGDRALLAYLVPDEDPINPLKDGSFGHIYSSHHHRGRDEHRKMQDALALNAAWKPDLDLLEERGIIQEPVEQCLESIQRELSPSTEYIEVDWYAMRVTCFYPTTTRRYDVEVDGDTVTFRDVTRTFANLTELWQAALKAGTIGARYAVPLDVYDHSSIHYSVAGEGVQRLWDTAQGGAVWVPDEECLTDIESHPGDQRTAQARALARSACQVYTAYVNGDVYGIVLETYERDGEGWVPISEDSCWGYFEHAYAAEEMQRQAEAHVKGWEA